MTSRGEMKFQIGKGGITQGVIESLTLAFKTHKKIRISVLKNSVRDKTKVREMAEELADRLQGDYNPKIIGFTIILRKVSKAKKGKGKV